MRLWILLKVMKSIIHDFNERVSEVRPSATATDNLNKYCYSVINNMRRVVRISRIIKRTRIFGFEDCSYERIEILTDENRKDLLQKIAKEFGGTYNPSNKLGWLDRLI